MYSLAWNNEALQVCISYYLKFVRKLIRDFYIEVSNSNSKPIILPQRCATDAGS